MSITEKLARERRARLAAERLLEQKKRELLAANSQLSRHARHLSDQIVEHRHGLEQALCVAETLKGQHSQVMSDLRRATDAAEIAERRLWEAVEAIQDGFAVFDISMHLVAANAAWFALFARQEKVHVGMHYDLVLQTLADAGIVDLDGEDIHDWRHEMTERITRADIPPKTVRLTDGRHVRFIDRRGSEGDMVSMVLDITEAMEREAALEEARARAEAANRAKSAFLANMSHEIRTPMNGVVGMAELLIDTELTDEQKLFAETIKSCGEALLTIINDVLDYSKIGAEKLRLYPEPFDLERCLHEVVLLLQPSARERGVRLLVDFDLFLPTRYVGDPGRMRQILTNLLGNAVKFTSEGHVLARVVGLELPDKRFDLHITVEDTGIGIPPDCLDHIFGEFNQVEEQSNRRFEGTGLGLAITRQLVELMGGTIWVDSAPGQGSCFGFRVTLAPAEPLQDDDRPDRPILLKRALIVDTVQINGLVLERQLQTCGLEVSMCRSAGEALQAVASGGAFDVILSDHDMSGMEGPELAAQLRAAGITSPILLLSSYPEAVEGKTGDVAAVLQKPILRSSLFRTLQDLSYPDGKEGFLPLHPAEPDPPEPERRQMRVLAAEDNRTNQLVFRKMVADLDIDLQFAGNGREAVDQWRSFRPDMVFMDISMPEMDGRAATRAIRTIEAERGLNRTPIVALTAHALDGDSEVILAAGIDHYLTKPLKKAEIAARIGEYCPPNVRPALGRDQPADNADGGG